ncbi:rho GTPase-activating protein [Microbotryomycetes sp. JL201]|nr:rho GTPase-activating protein [Microbotryomycetes sp. JL201]
MLGRRSKKRQGSVTSVDVLNAPQHASETSAGPSRGAFNLLVERAKGALGREKARTSSDEGPRDSQPARPPQQHTSRHPPRELPTSTSTRSFFSSASNKTASQGDGEPFPRAHIPTSSSMYDLSATTKAAQSNPGLFKRATAMSNPLKPAWLASTAPAHESSTPVSNATMLVPSASSPLLSVSDSSQDRGEPTGDWSRMQEGQARMRSRENLSLRKSASKSTEDLASRRHSRMFLDGIPPMPIMSRASTEDLSPDVAGNQARSRAPSSSSTSTSGGRRTRTTSLAPSAALDSYPSPSLTTSATSASTSRSPSPSHELTVPGIGDKAPPASPTLTSGSGDRDWKRDSQTIWFQGFLLRKGDYVPFTPKRSPSSPSGSGATASSYFGSNQVRPSKSDQDLQRGWKPYSAVLKGSKLYLHKLPGDLSSTARYLFPTTKVDESQALQSLSPIASPMLGDEGGRRRQRTFWGAGNDSHPALVRSESPTSGRQTIKSGTLEAAIHELVFATTATNPLSETAFDEFRRTLLLVWPYLPVPAGSFEHELGRYAKLALDRASDPRTRESSASTEAAMQSATRLSDLIAVISAMYPQDLRHVERGKAIWSELGRLLRDVASTIDSLLPDSRQANQRGVSAIVSGAYETLSKASATSRPLTEWQPVPGTPSTPKSTSSSPTKTRKRPGTESPAYNFDQLLQLSPPALAAQIHMFHVDRLAAISGNVTAARHILRTASLLLASEAPNKTTITSMFSFSASSPHFLTRIILDMILSTGTSTTSKPMDTENRAQLIEYWVAVGEHLRKRGDMAGWAAIAMALCSRASTRLCQCWMTVPPNVSDVVRSVWATLLSDAKFVDGDATFIHPVATMSTDGTGVPFFGSILSEAVTEFGRATAKMSGSEPVIDFARLCELRTRLDKLKQTWTHEAVVDLAETPNQQIQFLLQSASRLPPAKDLPTLGSYLPSSLGIEPRFPTQGLNTQTRARPASDVNPLLPLLNVETLPHITLMDQQKIGDGSFLDGGSNRKKDIDGLRRRNSYPPTPARLVERLGTFAKLRREIKSRVDTLLPFAEGDIVFRIVTSASVDVSRRTSGAFVRTPSWIETKSKSKPKSNRASIGSNLAPLSRSSSRRDSSPVSQRSSESGAGKAVATPSAEPVQVVVQTATVEALIDTIILGTGIYRTPSTDADGQPSLSGGRSLSLDRDELIHTFFSAYHSFSSPLAVLDMFRKRFLAATNAATELAGLTSDRPFPSWSLSPAPVESLTDTAVQESAARIRVKILEALRFWIAHFATDFLDSDDLWSSTLTLLDYVTDLKDWSNVSAAAQEIRQELVSAALRPNCARQSSHDASAANTVRFDRASAKDLVDHLDALSCTSAKDITERELQRWIDALEISSLSDPAAWYSSRQLSAKDEEDVVIADPYSHMLGLVTDSALAKHLPLSLRRILGRHTLVRKWVLAHLVDPNISARDRQLRMLKALEMIEHCRSRMVNVAFGGQKEPVETLHDPTIASFVERAVVSAIIAPESRLFASSWLAVASTRGVAAIDSVLVLVRREPIATQEICTVDVAWVVERMLEIVTQVDSLSDGMAINFAKRRWICNMIKNAVELNRSQPNQTLASWSALEGPVQDSSRWSWKVLKDAAAAEGAKSSRPIRPFARLVVLQQEKLKREKVAKEQILKGQKLEQQTRLQKEKEVARAMDRSVNVRARRMTSIFNFGRSTTPVPTNPPVSQPTPSAHALQALREYVPQAKPYLVLALSGVDAHALQDAPRSFVFELTTEDGQRSLFQAPNKRELDTWIEHFKRSGSQIAFRRATFLAQTALAEESEEVATRSPKPALRSLGGGLSEVGIYRISGENKVIQDMRDGIDRGLEPGVLFATTDVHNVTGLLKLFLRELPEPVVPFELYADFIASNSIEDYDERHYAIRDLIWRMPQPNFVLLRCLMEHLDKVTDNEGVNAMHAANLSIIFAPTLLKPPPGPAAFGLSMTNLGQAANAIKAIILQQHWIFADFGAEETEASAATAVDSVPDAEQSSGDLQAQGEGNTLVITSLAQQASGVGLGLASGYTIDPGNRDQAFVASEGLSLDLASAEGPVHDESCLATPQAMQIPGVQHAPVVDVFTPSSAPLETTSFAAPAETQLGERLRPVSMTSAGAPTTPPMQSSEGFLGQLSLPSPLSPSLFSARAPTSPPRTS